MRKGNFTGVINSIGLWASLACALHCAFLPVLLTISLFSGLEFLEDHAIEVGVLAFSASIAFLSLVPTYLQNRWPIPLYWALGGFVLILSGHAYFSSPFEHFATVVGALMVAGAHWMNRKCRKPTKNMADS
jgi:hypothetical protein